MFIAIEGPDGSGKSSLISAITDEISSRAPGVKIIHHHKGRPPEETRRCLLKEYAIDFQHKNVWSQTHLADRWHWGERTYAPIKRPHTNVDGYGLLGVAGWRWVELFMRSRGMAQFLTYQPPDVLRARISARGDDFIDQSEISWIYDAYMETKNVAILAGEIEPSTLKSFDDLPVVAKNIVDTAEKVAKSASHLSQFPEYIGHPKPTALLVGDKRNITKEYGEETILPFMPVSSSSGSFLMSSLPNDLWKTVGIVNGNDISSDRLYALYEALGYPRTVALGRLAERAILGTTIHHDDYETLPHPQYVRRFYSSRAFEYGSAIQKASRGEDPGHWKLH